MKNPARHEIPENLGMFLLQSWDVYKSHMVNILHT